jgi:hypothetical protein
MLSVGDAAGALSYVAALDNYTRMEPLPWADLFAARGRVLAAAMQDRHDEGLQLSLERVRDALADAGFRSFLPAVVEALAA